MSTLSILHPLMPGGDVAGDGGDPDLILDNDTIQPHIGGEVELSPLGGRRKISILCVTPIEVNERTAGEYTGVTEVGLRYKRRVVVRAS